MSFNREAFGDALQHGLKWRVIHWRLQCILPQLADWWQSSLNTEVRNRQSEVEIMMFLANAFNTASQESDIIDHAAIEAQAGHSKPPCLVWIPALSKFVQKMPTELIADLADFDKSYASKDSGKFRTMGSAFVSKLASLTFGPGEAYPYVLLATMCLQLRSPPSKVEDGQCRLISPGSLGMLAQKDKRGTIKMAEDAMSNARKMLQNSGLDRGQIVKLCGQLDVRLMAAICKKEKDLGLPTSPDLGSVCKVTSHSSNVYAAWCSPTVVAHSGTLVCAQRLGIILELTKT